MILANFRAAKLASCSVRAPVQTWKCCRKEIYSDFFENFGSLMFWLCFVKYWTWFKNFSKLHTNKGVQICSLKIQSQIIKIAVNFWNLRGLEILKSNFLWNLVKPIFIQKTNDSRTNLAWPNFIKIWICHF